MLDLKEGDCLELLKDIPNNSVDVVFADLPYGQVNCKWDCKIDLELLWNELKRIGKDTTPFIFTCTTKFGYELISSNKKWFKYDLVWVKTMSCGFLQSKKQPLRKHEMVYFFYKKQPKYDISSHKHKFLDSTSGKGGKVYNNRGEVQCKQYDPPLPISVIKEEICISLEDSTYGKVIELRHHPHIKTYDPPLPISVIKEDSCYGATQEYRNDEQYDKCGKKGKNQVLYDPPLPTSVVEVKSIRLKQHSTAKPPDLMKWILKYYSKEGDTILDPTMGSCPMGLACKEMNRKFIGFELDPDIYKFAVERTSKA